MYSYVRIIQCKQLKYSNQSTPPITLLHNFSRMCILINSFFNYSFLFLGLNYIYFLYLHVCKSLRSYINN